MSYDISSGEVCTGVILSGWMNMYVSSGGTANDTTVNSGGSMYVSKGGTANRTTVNPGGWLGVSSGGTANDILVSEGGRLVITVAPDTFIQGTSAGSAFTMQSSYISGYEVTSGGLQISSGGTASCTTVNWAGNMKVCSGGTADSTVVFSGGSMIISSGGTANGTELYTITETISAGTWYYYGYLEILNGATANSTTMDGGYLTISSGGTANCTELGCKYGNMTHRMTVHGTAIRTTVNSGGSLEISGGTANSTVVNSGGSMEICSATADSASINSGGCLMIHTGGTVRNIRENGGFVSVWEDAAATFVPNTFSGLFLEGWRNSATVHSGTTAVGTTINSAGWMYVYSGGTANSTTINFQGYLAVLHGGTANFTAVNSVGRIYVSSGGTAGNTTINSGGSLEVSSGGTASSTTINSGGSLVVSGDVTATSTTVNFGGYLTVCMGGTAHDVLENGGYVYVNEDADITFASNTFSGLVLNRGNSATVHSGTTATDTTNYGWLWVYSGGTANNTTVDSGGSMEVSSGGTVNSTTVNDWSSMVVLTGGTAISTTLTSGGSMEVSKGGMISGTVIDSGGSIKLASGCSADHTTVNSGVRLIVSQYVTANNTTVNSGGYLKIFPKATARNIQENGGYVVIGSNADATVAHHAFSGLVLTEWNSATVHSGTTAVNTTVLEGKLYVYSGGKVTGTLEIGSGGYVSVYDNAVIDFDISARTAGSAALVNDLSCISGTPDYTITVSATQTAGVYTLADGAGSFLETLSLGTSNRKYGSITVNGDAVQYKKRDFKLETADGSLILTVTKKDDVLAVNGKVIRYDGTLDVHTGSGTQTAGAIDSSNWTLLGGGSFGGGGNSGLLWQENSTGNVYMQNDAEDVSDLTAKSNLLGTVTEGYEIGGIGDFFGTGLDGALLLTPSFGDTSVSLNYGLAVWARESDGTTQNGWLGALVNTWDEVDGMNELKGDYQSLSGEARNQVINASNYRYELLGTADFNGDGKTDVMLRNNMPTTVSGETITGSGDVFIFLTDSHDNVLTGNRPAEGICYAGCATGGWNVVGFGDFNGDGIDDALLSDGSSLAGWQIVNGQRAGDYWFGPLSGWAYAGVGDFNGDGTADILVSQGNEFAVWTVKNGAISGSIAIA